MGSKNDGRVLKNVFKIFELTDNGTFVVPRYRDETIFRYNEYDSEWEAADAITRAMEDGFVTFGMTLVVIPSYKVVWS